MCSRRKTLAKRKGWAAALGLLALGLLLPECAWAAKIGDVAEESSLGQQALRFLSFRDPAVRYAVAGAVLLGISCGLLGCFIVVRKMALVGDTLSHAVLPGVALGFLFSGVDASGLLDWDFDVNSIRKNPTLIFIGAVIAGFIGTFFVSYLRQTTRIKEDTALGLTLASFFAIGVCLLTMIQRLPTGNKSGIDKFMFGQAAAIGEDDIRLMAGVTILIISAVYFFYKELVVTSFDAGFARAIALPSQWIHHLLMLLVAFAVVIALQAVGVVLVSAMLITPAAAAYLLTDRMHRMLLYAVGFGVASGVLGAFVSFVRPNIPTGPCMVLGASAVFAVAFFAGPRHGVLTRWLRHRSRSKRVQRENTLKAMYQVLENRAAQPEESVSLKELAERRRETIDEVAPQTRALEQNGLATLYEEGNKILFTPSGWQLACTIVRNHRLWELYLTNAANIAPDHVHDDAEEIEHVLGDEVVRELERLLDDTTRDPHGKTIPGFAEIHKPFTPSATGPSGYGGRS